MRFAINSQYFYFFKKKFCLFFLKIFVIALICNLCVDNKTVIADILKYIVKKSSKISKKSA